jgi:hypothetical protein
VRNRYLQPTVFLTCPVGRVSALAYGERASRFAIVSIVLQCLEAIISTLLPRHPETRQMRDGMRRAPIAGIDTCHNRQSAALPRAIIHRISP